MSTNNEIADDLRALGDLLERRGIIKSATPINLACTRMNRGEKRCYIQCLELNNVSGDYIRGNEWDTELEVKLTIDVLVKNEFIYNDVDKIIINLEYGALHSSGDRYCKGSWHFDYHVDMDGTGEDEEHRYIHPHYHVHHGGHKVKDLDSYGDLILLKSPRLQHHPLDAFLAIDLALSNFLEKREWEKVRAESIYKRAIIKSQKTWWQPFYEELGKYWQSKADDRSLGAKNNLSASKKLNPHLL